MTQMHCSHGCVSYFINCFHGWPLLWQSMLKQGCCQFGIPSATLAVHQPSSLPRLLEVIASPAAYQPNQEKEVVPSHGWEPKPRRAAPAAELGPVDVVTRPRPTGRPLGGSNCSSLACQPCHELAGLPRWSLQARATRSDGSHCLLHQ